jgi:hypothetical protein
LIDALVGYLEIFLGIIAMAVMQNFAACSSLTPAFRPGAKGYNISEGFSPNELLSVY